jgi:hypothetical protein
MYLETFEVVEWWFPLAQQENLGWAEVCRPSVRSLHIKNFEGIF